MEITMGVPRPVRFWAACSSVCRCASSRLISSSMRLANRYRRTHFPRFTMSDVRVATKSVNGSKMQMVRTPLVFPKLNWLFQLQLVGVHLGVKAVVWLEHDCQVTRTGVNRAPRRHRLPRVDLGLHVFQMSLSKTLDGTALATSSASATRNQGRNNLPGSSPTAKHHRRYPKSAPSSDRSAAGVLPSQTAPRSSLRGGCAPPRRRPLSAQKARRIPLAAPRLASRRFPG